MSVRPTELIQAIETFDDTKVADLITIQNSTWVEDELTLLHCLARSPLMNSGVIDKAKRIVNLLVSHGTQINARDPEFRTVISCLYAYPELVQELISLGADVDIADDLGWTPLTHACFSFCDYETKEKTVLSLLKAGADPNYVGLPDYTEEYTPLMAASEAWRERSSSDLIPILLSYGADPNLTDDMGYSALDYALHTRNYDGVIALLVGGAKPTEETPAILERLTKNHESKHTVDVRWWSVIREIHQMTVEAD